MKTLQVFKPGTFVADSGASYTFSEADLIAIAKSYDPAKHEAPLVVGHPKSDAPAYGWVKSVAFADGALCIEPDQVEPQFAELVSSGRFKKRSAAFYPPTAPQNPTPGSWYLRHIGFLGAKPPAVKGLRDVSFAEDDGMVAFMDWTQRDIASLFRGIRDFFIEQFGKEKADQAIPNYMIEGIQEDAVKSPAPSPTFSEERDVETKEQMEARLRAEAEERAKVAVKADADKLATERAEFAEQQKAEQRKKLQRDSAEFVDAQVKEGKVLPAMRDGLVAFMSGLDAAVVVEFGEGDKAVKKPGAEWLRDYLKAQPKVVEFGEHGNKGALPDASKNPERAGQEIAKRAVEFQESEKKAGRIVSIDVAVQHVTQGEQA